MIVKREPQSIFRVPLAEFADDSKIACADELVIVASVWFNALTGAMK